MSQQQKGWKEISPAGVCWKPASDYHTGDWRTFKPIRDPEKCTKCLLCHMVCPDAAIKWSKETQDLEFDYDYCKGCGICANECPLKAIKMVQEEGE
jgi:pyruvate ferredoxin oxidoreductase delta subunit